MTAYAKAWEQEIRDKLVSGKIRRQDLEQHLIKISWLQHERLIHLLVTIVIVILMVVFFILLLLDGHKLIGVVFVVLFILLCFYIQHYYFLENCVQRWYGLYDRIRAALEDASECL